MKIKTIIFSKRDCLPRLFNLGIDVDLKRKTINIPATGDIELPSVDNLICAIRHATDLAAGRITIE